MSDVFAHTPARVQVPDEVPTRPEPIRSDPPGSVTAMPSPAFIGHVHIFTDENYEKMVDFYVKFFAGEVIARQREYPMTFIAYDEYDHRITIVKKEDWGPKSDRFLGYSHLAFGYRSLGEILFIFKRMKEWGYAPHWTVNHGNSTSIYYRDPDGNEVETMVDNYAPIDTKAYKKHFQFSDEFGLMAEGNFDVDKMVELYEAGVPDTVLLDREEVKRLKADGKL
jgi:catechol-2,3-dioxygenase